MQLDSASTTFAYVRLLLEIPDATGEESSDLPARLLAEVCRNLGADVLYVVTETPGGWARDGVSAEGALGRMILPRPAGIVRHVLSRRARVLETRISAGSPFHRHADGWPGHPVASFLATPLHRRGRLHGVLALLRGHDRPGFEPADLPRAELLADALALRAALRETVSELSRAASIDDETRVLSRRQGSVELETALRRGARMGESVSVLLIDLEDALSAASGPSPGVVESGEILRRAALVLGRGLRGADRIARFASTSFMIVLPETALPEAQSVARRLCAALAASGAMACRAGAACMPGDGADPARLLAAASRRLSPAPLGLGVEARRAA